MVNYTILGVKSMIYIHNVVLHTVKDDSTSIYNMNVFTEYVRNSIFNIQCCLF